MKARFLNEITRGTGKIYFKRCNSVINVSFLDQSEGSVFTDRFNFRPKLRERSIDRYSTSVTFFYASKISGYIRRLHNEDFNYFRIFFSSNHSLRNIFSY